jgi:ubiquinone biosynthesis protein UbiJ
MAEGTLELLGEQLTRPFEELRGVNGRLDRLESALDKLATKEQVAIVWRSLELKVELGLEQHHDAVAELKRSVAALEARVRALEERPD